jgi:N-acetylglucosaminyldiphosphoundecaprenol N-acetyl-beta-D-mannosaminyltransferase
LSVRSHSLHQLRKAAQLNPQGSKSANEHSPRLALVAAGDAHPQDDLARPVYCLLGMPIDAVDTEHALRGIAAAVNSRKPMLLSTPNLNFLAHSLHDETFREALLASDLSTADGMPIVWIAQLLGVPIHDRVAGSDLFAELKLARLQARNPSVFFFGGAGDAAKAACQSLNSSSSALMTCAGYLNPGYGCVATMSDHKVIEEINASNADILVVALGAAKGQAWLLANHDRITIPVRAHLGAVISFQAGTARRAPVILQRLALEWLWRIKEEPHLWRRYWSDGLLFLRLFIGNVLPLWLRSRRPRHTGKNLSIEQSLVGGTMILALTGAALAQHTEVAITSFRAAMAHRPGGVVVDLSRVTDIDARFIGLLMMLRKSLRRRNGHLEIIRASTTLKWLFTLHAAAYLLGSDRSV